MIKDTTLSPNATQTVVGKVKFTPLSNDGTPGAGKEADVNYKGTAPASQSLNIVNGTVGADSTITISGYDFEMDANGEWQEVTD